MKQEKKGNQELKNLVTLSSFQNADFEMHSVDIGGKHIELLIISKAVEVPVTFEKLDYIRVWIS